MSARRPLALVLALVVAGVVSLAAAPAGAITNGQPDDGDPEVAALIDSDGYTICTGTLVAPGAVLTAAHCLDDKPPANVYFGATPPALGRILGVASVEQHPNYDPVTHAHDIGIVRLTSNPPITPAPLATMPLGVSAVGETIRIVGFGRTATTDEDPARKRTGQSRIDSAGDTGFTFRPSPSQTCFGDSGGPAFALVGGVEELVGVTSTGDLSCEAGASDASVQSFDTGFVAGYIAGASASPAVAGGCSVAGAREGDAGGLAALALLLVVLRRSSLRAP